MTNSTLHLPARDTHGKELLTVAVVLAVGYFLIVLGFGYFSHLGDIVFATPDSISYLLVGNWLLGGEQTDATLIRPYLYPLILVAARSLAGVYGIWMFQFCVWLASGLLLYLAIKTATGRRCYAIVGLAILATNLTFILLTLHGLTEVTVVFLLTLMCVLIVNKANMQTNRYWPLMIFVAALLTVIKPLYLLLLLILFIYRFPFFIATVAKKEERAAALPLLFLALSPVLFQLLIMKSQYGDFAISHIGARTFQNYYFAKLYANINGMSVIEARERSDALGGKMLIGYITAHGWEALRTYFALLMDNFISKSNFVDIPTSHPLLSTYMRAVNVLYTTVHLLMLPITLFVLGLSFAKRRYQDLEMMLSLMLPMWLIVASSGITFWQGDRIIVPILPLAITLYAIVVSRLFPLAQIFES